MSTRIAMPVWSQEMMTYLDGLPNTTIALAPASSTESLDILGSAKRSHPSLWYDSAFDLKAAVSGLPPWLGIVAYNPEHRIQTPESEQAAIVTTVGMASTWIRMMGIMFLLVPDLEFDDANAAAFAPFVDIYIVQGQKKQSKTTTFRRVVEPIVKSIRAANLLASVYVQVSVNGASAAQAYAAIKSLKVSIDGVSIWAQAGDLDAVKALVGMLG